MKKIISKLRSKRGESLVETMCSILIFTLSSIILLSMISTASNINGTVKKEEKAIAEELEIAEMQSSTAVRGTLKLTYGSTEALVDVNFYSDDAPNALYSYKAP